MKKIVCLIIFVSALKASDESIGGSLGLSINGKMGTAGVGRATVLLLRIKNRGNKTVYLNNRRFYPTISCLYADSTLQILDGESSRLSSSDGRTYEPARKPHLNDVVGIRPHSSIMKIYELPKLDHTGKIHVEFEVDVFVCSENVQEEKEWTIEHLTAKTVLNSAVE